MVDSITQPITTPQFTPPKDLPIIDEREIKQILYLGLRGDVSLPVEERKVDILV